VALNCEGEGRWRRRGVWGEKICNNHARFVQTYGKIVIYDFFFYGGLFFFW